MMLIKNARILTMEGEIIEWGYLRFDKIIREIGTMAACWPQEEEEPEESYDAQGGWLLPGLIDAHTHLGMVEDSIGFEGDDVNELSDPITPQLNPVDAINPLERSFIEAREAGVTTVVTGPGSANPISGQLVAIKTYGRRIDDMVVKAPIAMKFSLGENPKSAHGEKAQSPMTRMATAALIRENLHKAYDYHMDKTLAESDDELDKPDYDPKLEALCPLFTGHMMAHFHAHRADDIFTALRIAKEFSLKFLIIHGTEGHLIADYLKNEGVGVVSGPFLTDRSKPELKNLSTKSPAILNREGVACAISTDHPETPLKFLLHCAVVAVQEGMDEMEALKAITLVPAALLGLDHKIGSIKKDKDSDFVLFSGNPFEYTTKIKSVWIGGEKICEK